MTTSHECVCVHASRCHLLKNAFVCAPRCQLLESTFVCVLKDVNLLIVCLHVHSKMWTSWEHDCMSSACKALKEHVLTNMHSSQHIIFKISTDVWWYPYSNFASTKTGMPVNDIRVWACKTHTFTKSHQSNKLEENKSTQLCKKTADS